MYTEEDIVSAVKAGVFTNETANAFRAHVARIKGDSVADEEHFRLITGFNDIFVVIACALLLTAVNWIGADYSKWLGTLASAITAWGLAEFFVLKRRMALPAIVLLLAFVGNMFVTGFYLFKSSDAMFVAGSVMAATAAGLHWYRFRVPITMAAGTAAVIGFFIAALLVWVPETRNRIPAIMFAGGLVVFALAMWWDSQDTARQSRQSDVAFWLHLLAAPLLVHPVFAQIGVFNGAMTTLQATVVIVLYVVIGLVSLGIDRRALMVSSLIYVLYTFSTLLKQFGVVSLGFAITALVIGATLLLLSAFWHPVRGFVVRFLPNNLRMLLPPVR
jgi:hypothetical protein